MDRQSNIRRLPWDCGVAHKEVAETQIKSSTKVTVLFECISFIFFP
jgi:hypothetical protein